MYSLPGARRETQPPGGQLQSQELQNERVAELQSSVEVACRVETRQGLHGCLGLYWNEKEAVCLKEPYITWLGKEVFFSV